MYAVALGLMCSVVEPCSVVNELGYYVTGKKKSPLLKIVICYETFK